MIKLSDMLEEGAFDTKLAGEWISKSGKWKIKIFLYKPYGRAEARVEVWHNSPKATTPERNITKPSVNAAKAFAKKYMKESVVTEAKVARFYIRHPLDMTKAIRVLKAAGISTTPGINKVMQIASDDVEQAIEILTHHKVDFEPTRKRLKTELIDRTPRHHGDAEIKSGAKVIIPKGIGYNITDTGAFKRATKPVEGTVSTTVGNTIYIRLPDDRVAKTRKDLVQIVEAVSPRWKGKGQSSGEMFDYPRDPETGGFAHGTPEMSLKLKSLWAKGKLGHEMGPGGKCAVCKEKFITYPGGAVHPGTPAAKYLFKKGIIKKWK